MPLALPYPLLQVPAYLLRACQPFTKNACIYPGKPSVFQNNASTFRTVHFFFLWKASLAVKRQCRSFLGHLLKLVNVFFQRHCSGQPFSPAPFRAPGIPACDFNITGHFISDFRLVGSVSKWWTPKHAWFAKPPQQEYPDKRLTWGPLLGEPAPACAGDFAFCLWTQTTGYLPKRLFHLGL